ncbi:TPA: hypothetical protein RUM08_004773 [Escherichia coli]|nr:hypothetical protein [Escherichia coli]
MNNKYRLIIPVFFIALVDSNGSVSKMHHSLGKLNMLHSYTPSGKGVVVILSLPSNSGHAAK